MLASAAQQRLQANSGGPRRFSPHARWKRGNRLPPEVWIESLRVGRDISRPRRFVTENTANTPTRRLPPGGVD